MNAVMNMCYLRVCESMVASVTPLTHTLLLHIYMHIHIHIHIFSTRGGEGGQSKFLQLVLLLHQQVSDSQTKRYMCAVS